VRPDREIDLVPQVPGTIVWMSPSLEAGGFFEAGQVLARVDPIDFQLAMDQAEAEVARARHQLDIALGEAEVAREEWERLATNDGLSAPSDLAMHVPQVEAARAGWKAADARLREARLHLQRTELSAPFAGRVRATSLDIGQYVSPGRAVARLYSIERAEVSAPVPDEELAWIEVPAPGERPAPPAPILVGTAAEEQPSGAPAEVVLRARYAGRDHTWTGRVVRTEGEIDPRSRMVNVVIDVDDPYGDDTGRTAPLMVGLFVDVEIQGRPLANVRAVPRRALHADDTVWLAGTDGRLHLLPVEVLRVGRHEALVRFEAEPAAQVITSQLKGVTDGMLVRMAAAEVAHP
jgi:RND family efflux transporter MFP subunit